jgi:hypothetical protein
MTESEYIKSIRNEFAANEKGDAQVLEKLEDGLKFFPQSVELWCLRGHLILLSEGGDYELRDALDSYKKAVTLDPDCLDAIEELGYFYDVIERDPESALPYFRKAVASGARKKTRKALLDVIAQIQAKSVHQNE